jgi:predicted  nucleic acid-binding Zn-ribbon protein
MSLSVGFPPSGAITFSAKLPLSLEAQDESSTQGVDEDGKLKVSISSLSQDTKTEDTERSDLSAAAQILLKRMKELQEQLKQLREQLAAAQAADYPTPEAKTTVVMAIQGQIADVSSVLQEVVANLVKELSKDSTSGGLISTSV